MCGFFPQFFPPSTETLYLRKKCVWYFVHNPSRRFTLAIWRFIIFFSPSAGSSEGKGFQYFQVGMLGSPEELVGDREAKIYYFKIEKEEWGKSEKQPFTNRSLCTSNFHLDGS